MEPFSEMCEIFTKGMFYMRLFRNIFYKCMFDSMLEYKFILVGAHAAKHMSLSLIPPPLINSNGYNCMHDYSKAG